MPIRIPKRLTDLYPSSVAVDTVPYSKPDGTWGEVALSALGGTATTPYVTPEMFGAKGDGVTDDAPAFTLALAALESSGGEIRGSGTYYFATSYTHNNPAVSLHVKEIVITDNDVNAIILDHQTSALLAPNIYVGKISGGCYERDTDPAILTPETGVSNRTAIQVRNCKFARIQVDYIYNCTKGIHFKQHTIAEPSMGENLFYFSLIANCDEAVRFEKVEYTGDEAGGEVWAEGNQFNGGFIAVCNHGFVFDSGLEAIGGMQVICSVDNNTIDSSYDWENYSVTAIGNLLLMRYVRSFLGDGASVFADNDLLIQAGTTSWPLRIFQPTYSTAAIEAHDSDSRNTGVTLSPLGGVEIWATTPYVDFKGAVGTDYDARIILDNDLVKVVGKPLDVAGGITSNSSSTFSNSTGNPDQLIVKASSGSTTKQAGMQYMIDTSVLWQFFVDNADSNLFKLARQTASDVVFKVATNLFTFLYRVVFSASSTTRAPVNIPSGTAPNTPVDGDLWRDSGGLKYYDGSATRVLNGAYLTTEAMQDNLGGTTGGDGFIKTADGHLTVTYNDAGDALTLAVVPRLTFAPTGIEFGSASQQYDVNTGTASYVSASAGGALGGIPTAGSSGNTLADAITAITTSRDGNYLYVQELTGAASATNPLTVHFLFTGITTFDTIECRSQYVGSVSHNMSIQLWNWTGSTWDTYATYAGEADYTSKAIQIFSPSLYIGTGGDAGKVKLQWIHLQSGVATHEMRYDFVALSSGGGGGGTASIASAVTFTPAGNIAATNVQTALQELDTEKAIAGVATSSGLTVSTTSRVLGRVSAGSGAIEEITIGSAASQVAAGDHKHVDRLVAVFDGGGSAIADAKKVYVYVPWTCTVQDWTLLADQSGTISIDVWRYAYSGYAPGTHPVNGDSITGGNNIAVSGAAKGQDLNVTNWAANPQTLTADDVLCFCVEGAATSITWCTAILTVTRS